MSGAGRFAVADRSARTPGVAALAFTLTLGAPPASARDYRERIMEQAIRPCLQEQAGDTPAVARRQIYRIALRSCIRQGAAVFGER